MSADRERRSSRGKVEGGEREEEDGESGRREHCYDCFVCRYGGVKKGSVGVFVFSLAEESGRGVKRRDLRGVRLRGDGRGFIVPTIDDRRQELLKYD
jgi:hypothetical protein